MGYQFEYIVLKKPWQTIIPTIQERSPETVLE
jgi:hypothetical protein